MRQLKAAMYLSLCSLLAILLLASPIVCVHVFSRSDPHSTLLRVFSPVHPRAFCQVVNAIVQVVFLCGKAIAAVPAERPSIGYGGPLAHGLRAPSVDGGTVSDDKIGWVWHIKNAHARTTVHNHAVLIIYFARRVNH